MLEPLDRRSDGAPGQRVSGGKPRPGERECRLLDVREKAGPKAVCEAGLDRYLLVLAQVGGQGLLLPGPGFPDRFFENGSEAGDEAVNGKNVVGDRPLVGDRFHDASKPGAIIVQPGEPIRFLGGFFHGKIDRKPKMKAAAAYRGKEGVGVGCQE